MRRSGSTALTVLAVLIAATVGVAMMAVHYNNAFVGMEERVKGAWAQVDNQLKRRADLVPNLVESVKGYTAHERDVFATIAAARAKLAGIASPAEKMQANADLTVGLNRLLAVAEAANPDLKSAPLFRQLMDELAGTENRLAVERMRYNEAVLALNTALRQLPGSLFGGALGIRAATYFEVPATEKATPRVSFAPGA